MKEIIISVLILSVIFLLYKVYEYFFVEKNANTKDYHSSWYKISNYENILKDNFTVNKTTKHTTDVPFKKYFTKENRRYDILKPENVNNLPVLIYFQPEGDYGIIGEDHTDNSALKQSLNILASTKKLCIVFLYPNPNDMWYWMEDAVNYDFNCESTYSLNNTSGGIACFTKGCPDDLYLSQVHDHLKTDSTLNLKKLAVIGYSAGAQMASLAISKFKELGFPDITVAVLIAGGVQYCYAYTNNVPDVFKPCKNKNIGCCPYNTLERSYMDKTYKMSSHPPTFLFQTENDNWADQNASINYYNSAVKFGVQTGKMIALNSSYHGLVYVQANAFINIIKRYLSI